MLTLTLTAARMFRDATQYKYETSLGIIITLRYLLKARKLT